MCSPILFTKSLGLASRHLRAALRQSIKASMAGSWGVGEGTRKMVIWGWFMLPLSLYMWFYVVTCSTYIGFFYDLLKCLEWIITSYQSRRWVVYHLGMVYGIGFTSWTGLTQQRTDWTNPIQGKLISPTAPPRFFSHFTMKFRSGWWFQRCFMGCHPSHWRTHIFQDGYCTTNQR